MSTLETALAAWIAFLAELGVDMNQLLLPPATEQQIIAVEQEIGYRLPDDLRELYLIANGQIDSYDEQYHTTDKKPDTRWAGLFGYRFLPLDQALEAWRMNRDIYSDPMYREPDFALDIREGDPLEVNHWSPGWFVFAGDTNHYSVDTRPPAAGTFGQVVAHGADELELRVVASGIVELMQSAAKNLDPLDNSRFRLYKYEGDYWESVSFDMDWRAETEQQMLEREQREYEEHQRQQQDWLDRHPLFVRWMEEREMRQQQLAEDMSDWLLARNYSEAQRDEIMNGGMQSMWGGMRLMDRGAMPAEVLAELQAGEAEELDNLYASLMLAQGVLIGTEAEPPESIARMQEIRYLYTAASLLTEHGSRLEENALVPAEEKVRAMTEYYRQKNVISQVFFNRVNQLITDFRAIPKDQDSSSFGPKGGELNPSDPIIEICGSDDCHEFSLLPYLSQ